MAGNKRPVRPYAHKLEARIIALEARVAACMDGVEKLAAYTQTLGAALGRIITAAQASKSQEDSGIVIASARELPKP